MPSSARTTTSQPRQTRSQTTHELKWGLNLSKPVSRLPTEVLLLIFEWVFLEYNEAKEMVSGHWRNLKTVRSEDRVLQKVGWVTVSQVCHRWRVSAMGTPTFWSKIEVEDGRCRRALEMLKRSKDALLTMYIDLGVLDSNRAAKTTKLELARAAVLQAQKQLARCRELVLVRGTSTTDTTIESLLSGVTMPHLRLLSTPWPSKTVLDPADLSVLKADHLTVLEIDRARLDWNAPFVQRLTKMKLHYYPEILSLIDIMDYLAMMPSLRELDIQTSIDSSDLDLIRAHPLNKNRLRLTHLDMLNQSITQSAALLSVVAPMSLHHVACNINVTNIRGEDEANFSSLLQTIVNAIDTKNFPLRSYLVTGWPTYLIIDGGSNTSLESLIQHSSDVSAMVLHLAVHPSNAEAEYIRSLLDIAAKCLPKTQLEVLLYMTQPPIEGTDWHLPFSNISTLTDVHVQGPPLLSLFKTLHLKDSFQSLRRLSCIVPSSFDEHVVSTLLRSLETRHQRGQPIAEFFVDGDHGLTPEDVKALLPFVGKLYL